MKVSRKIGLGCLALVLVAFVPFFVAGMVDGFKSGHKATPAQQAHTSAQKARTYISTYRPEWSSVARGQKLMWQAFTMLQQPGQMTQANTDELATVAQEAHDDLNTMRSELANANDSGPLGTYETDVWAGVNGFKNAEGALVAYLGTPNAAAYAHFTTQYQSAVGWWNAGVDGIWRLAGETSPPTV